MAELLNISTLKRRAKELKKTSNLTHSQALDAVAQYKGYHNWAHLMKEQNRMQREEEKAEDRIPTSSDAHLSRYEHPDYVRTIFR